MKTFYLLIAVISITAACNSKSITTKPSNRFEFKQLTFHSSVCNGTYPDLSMNIFNDKRIELSRTLFKGKGEEDSTRSGTYKGQLTQTEFDQLLKLIKEVNWDTVSFLEVTCCDRPVKTIIINYNGKYKRLKSMNPSEDTRELINYLTTLGTQVQLPVYNQPIDFEDVPDAINR
jgi:hypothetical protein